MYSKVKLKVLNYPNFKTVLFPFCCLPANFKFILKSDILIRFFFSFFLLISCQPQSNNGPQATSSVEGVLSDYQLVWSDEFDEDGQPDASKWSYDLGDGCPRICGWGNNELEYYTNSLKNARVEDGHLIIEALHNPQAQRPYTSARLVTKGKGDWTYGKIEVRSKNPSGRGTWPAVWMLPTHNAYGQWPKSGEIDIMEHVGFVEDTVYGTVHTEKYNHGIGTQKGGQLIVPTNEQDFHTYSIEWSEDKIDFLIDDHNYFTFRNDYKTYGEWPFDKDFHLLLNLAVGGNWGGKEGVDTSIWPQQMVVDYVRVYKKEDAD